MKKIAFLGGGKIGRAMAEHVKKEKKADVLFFYDPFLQEDEVDGIPVIKEKESLSFSGLDVVVECATSEVIEQYAEAILKECSLMTFSMTAFRDDALLEKARRTAEENGHTLYFPHGAILGLDGIFDGRKVLTEVSIDTIKNPKSLGREDKEKTVVFDGTAREATGLYPRNVNVHAAISLAGIGFDKTHSRIISDPAVDTNEHIIHLKGEGIDFTVHVRAFAAGAVSGKYVPFSACGSLDRVLGADAISFV